MDAENDLEANFDEMFINEGEVPAENPYKFGLEKISETEYRFPELDDKNLDLEKGVEEEKLDENKSLNTKMENHSQLKSMKKDDSEEAIEMPLHAYNAL